MDHHEVKWYHAEGCGCFLGLLAAVILIAIATVVLVKGNQ